MNQPPLEISFHTKALRTTCEIASRARALLGAEVAAALHRRLADLRAARVLHDLVAGRPRPLPDRTHQIAINLDHRHRLILRPNHRVNPVDTAGTLDWTRVARVKIVEILEDPNV